MIQYLAIKLLTLTLAIHSPLVEARIVRQSADQYAMIGVGSVRTAGCTITANWADEEIARIETTSHGSWVVFRDASGEIEGTCKIAR